MEVQIGPFDPALDIQARDYYAGVQREAQLLALQPDAPPRRYDELIGRLRAGFPATAVTEVIDRAYLAGEATFTATIVLPDELVDAALHACDELEGLLGELDRWAADPEVQLLPAPAEVRAYVIAFLAQARAQLQAFQANTATPPD